MARLAKPRRPILSASLAVGAAMVTLRFSLLCSTSFIAQPFGRPASFSAQTSPPTGLRGVVGRRAAAGEPLLDEGASRKQWQDALDAAFLDVDASLGERLDGLRRILLSPGDVAESLRQAVVAISTNRLSEGHVKALDKIFPRGTILRSDLEGLLAITRQAPEVMGDLVFNGGIFEMPQMPEVNVTAPSLDDVRESLQDLLSPQGISARIQGVRDGIHGMADTAVDGLRLLPKGLQEPSFELFDTTESFEVRRYHDFTLATRQQPIPSSKLSSADPFSALAVHLFSGTQRPSLNMTMPMVIRYNNISSLEPVSVSFVLPPGTQATGDEDDNIEIVQVPEKLLAIRRFPGIATAAEVKRQYEKLLSSFAPDEIYAPVEEGTFGVLQYNPPYTIPWRRRNEIAVEVTYDADNAERVARAKAASEAAAAAAAQAREEAEGFVEGMVEAEVIGS